MSESIQKQLNSYIRNYTKNDLMQMCKSKNLDIQGKKYDLAIRLVSKDKNEPIEVLFPSQKTKLEFHPPIIHIEKNELGHLIHKESQLVFNSNSRRVIGVQDSNGSIRDLDIKDIDECKKYKFPYDLPMTLNDITIYEILENSDYEKESNDLSDYEDEEEDEDRLEEDDFE